MKYKLTSCEGMTYKMWLGYLTSPNVCVFVLVTMFIMQHSSDKRNPISNYTKKYFLQK